MTKSVDNDRVQRVRNEREVKQIVPRTAVRQIAEACAAAICNGREIKVIGCVVEDMRFWEKLEQREVTERIAKTLDAIHASMCEGTKPNA